ncbi:MAG TPA: prolyl oligopeptidase family serine peptidase [Terriglobales bacterium]|nr:prolyl oligopeptidase family serine peptidase [Terriglobales bacterium]
MLWIVVCLVLMVAVAWAGNESSDGTTSPSGPPKAKVDIVEETIHGHKIADPYRWLEDASSADSQEYVRAELAYTRGILDPLPGREQIHQRLGQLLSIGNISTPQIGGPYYFYTRREGMQNQPVLLVRESIHGKDRALVDANQLAADGTVALDWWFPSDDGKYMAYGTSASGSEISTLHVIETATGKLLPDTIEHTRIAQVSWKKDNSGFYYGRNPKKGDVPEGDEAYYLHIFYHELGTDPAKDPLIWGEGRKKEEILVSQLPDDDDRWLLLTAFEGSAGKNELFLQDLKAGSAPIELTSGKDFHYSGEIFRGKLYITTNEDAPHFRLFTVDAASPGRSNWKEIIPSTDGILKGTAIVDGKILAEYEKDASSQLKLFDLEGKALGDVALPGIGTIAGLGGRWDRKDTFFGFASFTIPPSVYQVELASRKTSLWDKVSTPGVDPSAFEVRQVWYTSKDGTKVPMFVFHKKGLQLNGKNPTLLTGYGGFNVSLTPTFSGARYLWLEHGGVFAVANLRGGSEFGEEWHRGGMLDKKQNVFDDFITAAEFLISDKITDKDHLAIQGGSNGGLLMGAALTQRPDLFRAVVCQVPLLDMLRYQNFLIAKFWVPEYGSAEDAKQFDWLYAYSPYHHVKPGAEYPAIMFMTADSDSRVDPMHAKKMAALMQAEASNGKSHDRPILLRIEPKAGHGQGKPISKQIEEGTDIYSFLFWQLGVKP